MQRSVTIQRSLTQADFDKFAELSGDDNPIHVDAEYSAQTRFGRTVSHGMLLATILRGLVDHLVPGARQVSQQLMFPAPTFADEPLRFSAQISSENGNLVNATVSCVRISDRAVTCDGSTTLQRAEP